MKNAYVTALNDCLLAGMPVETALTELRAVLDKRGHARLWPQIMKATYRILSVKLKRREPAVTVAKEGGVDEAAIKAALERLGVAAATPYATTIDPSLVGGFTLRVKDTLLDASYKRSLKNLYERIIS